MANKRAVTIHSRSGAKASKRTPERSSLRGGGNRQRNQPGGLEQLFNRDGGGRADPAGRSPARSSATGPTACATSRTCSTIRSFAPRPPAFAIARKTPAATSSGTPKSRIGPSCRILCREPLVELSRRIDEEIRRLESPDALVPIDRDPVPPEFAEQVRRYYERLGSGE